MISVINSTHIALLVAGAISVSAIFTRTPISDVVLILTPILGYAGIREGIRIVKK